MHEKKNILTYEGLRKYEDELHDLKVVKRKEVAQKIRKPENRATFPRMPSTTRPRMNSATLRPGLKSLRRFLKMPRLWWKTRWILTRSISAVR